MRFQSAATWVVALGLLVYEGVARHFVDQYGIALLGGLLGLQPVLNHDRKRRDKNGNGDTHD